MTATTPSSTPFAQPLPNSATSDAPVAPEPDFANMAEASVQYSTKEHAAAMASVPEEAPQGQWDAFATQARADEGNAHERTIRYAGQAMPEHIDPSHQELAAQVAALATPAAATLEKIADKAAPQTEETSQTQAS